MGLCFFYFKSTAIVYSFSLCVFVIEMKVVWGIEVGLQGPLS